MFQNMAPRAVNSVNTPRFISASPAGDGDELTDSRDQASDECGNGAVVAEERLLFQDLPGEQAQPSEAAVREFVYNRTSEKLREVVVDERADERAECREKARLG